MIPSATPIYGNEPSAFLQQLHTIAPRVQGVVLWTMLTMGEYPVMTDNTLQGHIDIYTFFYNNNCRDGHATGRFTLAPLNLHSVGPCLVATGGPMCLWPASRRRMNTVWCICPSTCRALWSAWRRPTR